MNIKILTIIMLSFLLSGCIYPVYRTIQPETKVKVVNTKGVALSEAKVYLYTQEYYPYKFKVEIVRSNKKGIAEFDSIKKWGTDMLMIHGIKPSNRWSLCIEKSNYVTQYINLYNEKKSLNQTVTLLEGESTICSERDNREVKHVHNRKYFFAIFAIDEENAMNVENMSQKEAESLGDVILSSWKSPSVKYLIKNKFLIDRFMVADAQASKDEVREGYVINIQLTNEGAKVFSDFTAKNIGKRVTIVLNDIVYSAPIIAQQISGEKVEIRGDFYKEMAFDIVNDLKLLKDKKGKKNAKL